MKAQPLVTCGALIALLLGSSLAFSQSANPPARVALLQTNVVRIDANGRTGFGFVVGLRPRELLIATAWHTVRELADAKIAVCFVQTDVPCRTGRVAYVADAIGSRPALDLAIIAVDYPEGMAWLPDVLAERPPTDSAVWFIGRSGEWYVPPRPGRVQGFDAETQLLSYRDLEVTEGVSGAPIVTQSGVVAMHVASVGSSGNASGVDVLAIRERVVHDMHARWILVAPTQCAKLTAQRGVLGGRVLTVYIDGDRPDLGLAAMAQLNCLGARTVPRPIWSGQPWPGDLVSYGSGDLRAARAVQSALSSIARLDARLTESQRDLAIWVR